MLQPGVCGVGFIYHFYWPSNTTPGIAVSDVIFQNGECSKTLHKTKCKQNKAWSSLLDCFPKEKNYCIFKLCKKKKNVMCLYVERSFVLSSNNFLKQVFFIFIYSFALGLNCNMSDLVPWPGIKPGSPALEACLNHQTTRKVPRLR